MRIGLLRFSWVAALAASWGMTWGIHGVTAQDRPGKGVLSGLSSRKESPRLEVSPNRMMEVQVELALMADPVTFPYYLEARADGTKMELRGFVPDKGVQEHALKLARLNSTLTVIDAMRLHSSLAVKTAKLAPEKLYASVHSALSRTLPVTAKSLRIECDSDGKVVVTGAVKNLDEKLAVSQSLRRLHGCGCVVNQTSIGTPEIERGDVASLPPVRPTMTTKGVSAERGTPEIVPVQAKEPGRPTPPPASAPPGRSEGPFNGFFGRLFGKKKTQTPEVSEAPPRFPTGGTAPRDPVKITNVDSPAKGTGWGAPPRPALVPGTPTSKSGTPAGPYEASGVIVAPGSTPPAGAPRKGKALSTAQLRARMESAFPKARPITITPQGGSKLKVEVTARTNEESNDIAGRLLSMPELESYDVDLHIRVDGPAPTPSPKR